MEENKNLETPQAGGKAVKAKSRAGSVVNFYRFEPKMPQFLDVLRQTWPNLTAACNAVGCDRSTVWLHRKNNPKFDAAVKEIIEQKMDELERVAMESAQDVRKGFLDRAMLLRAHRSELYDRAKVVKIEGYKMGEGERQKRAQVVESFIDAEVSKTYLTRREQQQRRAQLKAGEQAGGAQEGGGA